MRRRVRGVDADALIDPVVPGYVDDVSLTLAERVARYEAFMAEHVVPVRVARERFEAAEGVLIVDGFEGGLPDAPFDPSRV